MLGLSTLALILAAVAAVAASPDQALLALTEDNTLLRFTRSDPGKTERVTVSGASGTLLGIDVRPANGRLYGITSTYDVYTIDPASGKGARVSTLTVPFDGGARSGMDFNPQADRLRLVGGNGQNLRVNVDIGAAATDTPLAYVAEDRHFGKRPGISAAAYTNSVAAAGATKLFDIDASFDVLVLQEPPNDGMLVTVGPLGVDFEPVAGFDIITDGAGVDTAFAASAATLYTIDLKTGAATRVGPIGSGTQKILSLAALPADGAGAR